MLFKGNVHNIIHTYICSEIKKHLRSLTNIYLVTVEMEQAHLLFTRDCASSARLWWQVANIVQNTLYEKQT